MTESLSPDPSQEVDSASGRKVKRIVICHYPSWICIHSMCCFFHDISWMMMMMIIRTV